MGICRTVPHLFLSVSVLSLLFSACSANLLDGHDDCGPRKPTTSGGHSCPGGGGCWGREYCLWHDEVLKSISKGCPGSPDGCTRDDYSTLEMADLSCHDYLQCVADNCYGTFDPQGKQCVVRSYYTGECCLPTY